MKETLTLHLIWFCTLLAPICAEATEHPRPAAPGELRNLVLVEPTEHGKAEHHFPGPAILRLHLLPASR